MNCHEFIDFIMAYLDGELPQDQRAIFEQHIALCPDCDTYLDGYKKTVALGQQCYEPCAEDDDLPKDVPEHLIEAVLAARKKRE